MKTKRMNASLILIFSVLAILAACVTVNVNFPEGAVQKATDDYVKQLYETKKTNNQSIAPSLVSPKNISPLQFSFIATAHAIDTSEILNDPTIAAIQVRQKTRIKKIDAHKARGEIGENNQGLLEARTNKPILLAQIKTLIEEENNDRKAFYQAAAQKNNTPEKIFIKGFQNSIIKASPAGTPVQDEAGNWK